MKTKWRRFAEAQQIDWKLSTRTLPEDARRDGEYKDKPNVYRFCLPAAFADHNLLQEIRGAALTRFDRYEVVWHAATPAAGMRGGKGPSTHLLDSQIQCVNCLLSLEHTPEILLERLRQIEPEVEYIVPIRHANSTEGLVAFEWIGRENYLGERFLQRRWRGARVTSADALIVVECRNRQRTGFLIEWKFTENYEIPVSFVSDWGTDRREIYRETYENASGVFIAKRPPIETYFHEPHYQLLRQTLLAKKMLEAGEHGMTRVVVVLLAPAMNRDLITGVPDDLKAFGSRIDEVWSALAPGPDVRFVWQDTAAWITATPALAERYGGLLSRGQKR